MTGQAVPARACETHSSGSLATVRVRSGHAGKEASAVGTRYTRNMEVRLTPELENELASIAARSSRTPQQVAAEVLTRGLHQERRFIDSVEQGIASADAGRVIPDEAVLAWLHAQEARESS